MKICFAGMLLVCSAATIAVAQPVLEEVERNVRRQIGAPALAPAETGAAQPAGPQPGYLGVVADDRQENGRGIRVREVIGGGPAAKGGLQSGDLITAVNGRAVHTLDDMAAILGPLPAGQAVEFQVDRAGVSQKLGVTLGVRPAKGERRFPQFGKLAEDVLSPGAAMVDRPVVDAPLGAPGGPLLGVRTVPLTIELRRQFKVAADVDGALVTAVTGDSPADRIGLMTGMLITAVNGQAIRGPDTLSALVRQAGPGQEIDLSFRDQNGELHRRVALAGAPAAARPQQPPQPIQPPQLPQPSELSDPAFVPGLPPREEATIQSLERRIQQLEARVEKLEAALRAKE